MKVEQIYTGCLAQGAYFIQSEGEAVVIDPLREIAPYVKKAEKENVKIKYVLETHFHADFVSGHIDLANATGAAIVFGPNANTSFKAYIAKDGEELKVGKITIKVLHTPGHTMESTTYLLLDENGKEYAIFSGDTLFIGDVGRPDLAAKSSFTVEDLAGTLYDSLRNKIMTLPDDVIVYPAHGAGSSCGKNMSKETYDTLGNQKKMNYALRADMSKAEFIREVTNGLLPPPLYFPLNAKMNREGYDSITEVIKKGTRALNPAEFELLANESGALLLDVRSPASFAKGFVPNSINIGIDGSFAPWVGALIPDIKQQILLITDEGREEEAVIRLARVGYDNALGYLRGGFNAWKAAGKEVDYVQSVSVQAFVDAYNANPTIPVLDVRKTGEYEAGHITDAQNLPLDFINEGMAQIDKNKTYYVHCAGGYRSMIYTSILKSRGYENLINVENGFKAITTAGPGIKVSSLVQ
ncbi:MAG: MBL fold metallo-hydrolase [Bacteroidia bacterium]|jgi:glyoxylase-like metal-dependent hydrolase (beta-lactamase superfamily II)/rhodanese-related sulfurtransferase